MHNAPHIGDLLLVVQPPSHPTGGSLLLLHGRHAPRTARAIHHAYPLRPCAFPPLLVKQCVCRSPASAESLRGSAARASRPARSPRSMRNPSSMTPATARMRTALHIAVCTGLRYAASQLLLHNSSAAMGAARTARCLHNDEMRAHAPCIAGPSRFAAFVRALRRLPLFTAARGAAQRALLFTTPAYVCAPAAPRVDPCACDVLLTSSHWRSLPGSAAPATSVGALLAPCYLAGTARVRVHSCRLYPYCSVIGSTVTHSILAIPRPLHISRALGRPQLLRPIFHPSSNPLPYLPLYSSRSLVYDVQRRLRRILHTCPIRPPHAFSV